MFLTVAILSLTKMGFVCTKLLHVLLERNCRVRVSQVLGHVQKVFREGTLKVRILPLCQVD